MGDEISEEVNQKLRRSNTLTKPTKPPARTKGTPAHAPARTSRAPALQTTTRKDVAYKARL